MKTNPLSGQCDHFISRSLNKTSSGGMKTKLLLLLKQQELVAGALPAKRERRRIANLEKIITCQFRYFSGSKEQYSEEKNKKKIQNHDPKHVANHGSVEDCLTPSEAGKRSHRLRNDQDCNKSPLLGRMGMDTLLSHAGLTAWRKSNNNNGTKDHQDDNTSNMTLHSWNEYNEPLCPPLHLETTYTRPPSGDYFNPRDGGNGWVYSRIGNPTRKLLEDCMSRLEIITSRTKVMQGIVRNASRGEHALKENNDWPNDDDAASGITCAFSSGMAAVGAILLALPQRLHVVLPNDIYHGVPTQLKTMFVQRNVTYSTIDMTNIENVQCAIQQFMQRRDDENTNDNPLHLLVWMESPSNPQCKVVDIKAICDYVSKCREVDRRHGITTVVDSTWAPPPITQPLLVRIFMNLISLYTQYSLSSCHHIFSIMYARNNIKFMYRESARGRCCNAFWDKILGWAFRCLAGCRYCIPVYLSRKGIEIIHSSHTDDFGSNCFTF
jgi:cystathionine beta-lyase/cystathionine gamma-synthase